MHKCVRCGRAATSLQEINDGCPCGSKVFVFNKDAVNLDGSIAGERIAKLPGNGGAQSGEITAIAKELEQGISHSPALADGSKGAEPKQGDGKGTGKVPETYHARMSFSSEDVENIKVLTEGVFAIELRSLYRDPVVLKDEEGIYYVKIPHEQNEKAMKKLMKDDGKGEWGVKGTAGGNGAVGKNGNSDKAEGNGIGKGEGGDKAEKQ